jgi:hypothetical protein
MLSIENLRKHHQYRLTNYGERTSFVVLEHLSKNNYKVKSLDTLDIFELKNLIAYGLSPDYQLHEIEFDE